MQVFDPHGELLGKILVEGGIANFTFGGPKLDVLYLCAETCILSVQLQAQGVGPPSKPRGDGGQSAPDRRYAGHPRVARASSSSSWARTSRGETSP